MDPSETITNWDNLFLDLEKAECELSDAINSLVKASEVSKYTKLGFKSDDWRNLHSLISKNGKIIEKLYSGYIFENKYKLDTKSEFLWKEAIFETLVREGFTFNSKTIENTKTHGEAYSQLSKFIENFESESFLIFEWIKSNFPDSMDKENLLAEFTQYLFYQHLQNNDLHGALMLIRAQTKYFKAPDNQKMINRILTKSLYYGAQQFELEHSRKDSLRDHFVKSYCKHEKIPKTDPLSACNQVGTKSIPSLDRLNALLKGKNYDTLTSEEELPIELPLEEEYVFHSVFCCPVIKQQSSDDNPAFLLPCSHALSKEALNRLSKGNALVRFKCPYCPTETNLSNCLQLNF